MIDRSPSTAQPAQAGPGTSGLSSFPGPPGQRHDWHAPMTGPGTLGATGSSAPLRGRTIRRLVLVTIGCETSSTNQRRRSNRHFHQTVRHACDLPQHPSLDGMAMSGMSGRLSLP